MAKASPASAAATATTTTIGHKLGQILYAIVVAKIHWIWP